MREITLIIGRAREGSEAVPACPSGKRRSETRWEVKEVKWCESDCFEHAVEKITKSKLESNANNI